MYRAGLACVLASGCHLIFPLANDTPDVDGPVPSDPDAPLGSDAPPDALAAFTCPAGYAPLTNTTSSYRRSSSAFTFADAADECIKDRDTATGFTHLVVLDDLNELEQLRINDTDRRWIGLQREVNQPFEPVTVQQAMYPPRSGSP